MARKKLTPPADAQNAEGAKNAGGAPSDAAGKTAAEDPKLTMHLLPLKHEVPLPHAIYSPLVGREKSKSAVKDVFLGSGPERLFLTAQKDDAVEVPTQKDLYQVGVICDVLQVTELSSGMLKIMVRGLRRAKIASFKKGRGNAADKVTVEPLEPEPLTPAQSDALRSVVNREFKDYAKANEEISNIAVKDISQLESVDQMLCVIVGYFLDLPKEERQDMLETLNTVKLAEKVVKVIDRELQLEGLKQELREKVKKQLDKSHRDYYISEQVKILKKELGESEEDELKRVRERILAAGMTEQAERKALDELRKLEQLPAMSTDSWVYRNYIDTLINLPWKPSPLNTNISRARMILDADHYGLEKVKDRILEYLVVNKRVENLKAPILCLVGPPGVGKTSLGKSIAKATGRTFVRMALGGVHDESEIRGHRKTYVGSMPGKILQHITKAKCNNPLFLLDELDKIGSDFHGDPAAALLEVLDPEQNKTFEDNYVEVEYDLSNVLFIATSNSMDIHPALLDRMEIIKLSGYTEEEKIQIAERYLLPKQFEANGLTQGELSIDRAAIVDVVRYYTSEAGVRGLEREIAKICRKVVMANTLQWEEKSGEAEAARQEIENELKAKAKESNGGEPKAEARDSDPASGPGPASDPTPDSGSAPAQGKAAGPKRTVKPVYRKVKVKSSDLEEYLGPRKVDFDRAGEINRVGLINGLAWTGVGGAIMGVEANHYPGKGHVFRTGSLGDVMKESVETAISSVRGIADQLGLKPDLFAKNDLHLHFPSGAVPKDGPSAGGAIAAALTSSLLNLPARRDVALTGEITLRGEILPIGGLKEKLMAAQRGNIKTVLIPKENVKDLQDVPEEIKGSLEIVPVRWLTEVLERVLVGFKAQKPRAAAQRGEAESAAHSAAKPRPKAAAKTQDKPQAKDKGGAGEGQAKSRRNARKAETDKEPKTAAAKTAVKKDEARPKPEGMARKGSLGKTPAADRDAVSNGDSDPALGHPDPQPVGRKRPKPQA